MGGKGKDTDPIRLGDLKPRMPLEGKVTRIELYGAFVDVGAEQDGLLHISMIKRGHINRVQDVLEEGQTVQVWVHRVDPKAGRLQLTMIRPIKRKWKDLKPGSLVKGKVVRVETYGVFVDIGAERPGLVHISEISRDYVADPNEIVKVDDEVEVYVIEVNRKKRQIRLSMKLSVPDQEAEAEALAEDAVPTAMELALRSALKDADDDKTKTKEATAEKQDAEEASERKHQDDLLSRTLKHRVRTSQS
ncbi:MAG: S1 RNA-binding domain-containing protein [Anaerolineales bacterium]